MTTTNKLEHNLKKVNSPDNREFNMEEIRNAVESMDKKNAPVEDGITGKIYEQTFETFSRFITAMYNGCLRSAFFKRWKRAKLIPLVKPKKVSSEYILKYRPLSILNIVGKGLEEVLRNIINYRVYSTDFMNNNLYGFTQQKCSTDVAIAVNCFVEGLKAGFVLVLVSLDVKGAIVGAWWPSILKCLQACGCPKNLYNITKSYFRQSTVILSTDSVRMKTEIGREFHQVSCCDPGFWNIQYNSLLNLTFTRRTKAVAFADDLILVIRGKIVSEAESITNLEMNKITACAKSNKINIG